MKKLLMGLALLCLIGTPFLGSSQSISNQEKYWAYRDKLRKNFVRIGNEQGQSIPMAARSIGYAYVDAPDGESGYPISRIYYQDATVQLGNYLTVLATEYSNTGLATKNRTES